MSSHPQRYDACEVCGKRVFPTWTEARRNAIAFMRLSGKTRGVAPYWSKECRAIHVGHSSDGAYRKAKRT